MKTFAALEIKHNPYGNSLKQKSENNLLLILLSMYPSTPLLLHVCIPKYGCEYIWSEKTDSTI